MRLIWPRLYSTIIGRGTSYVGELKGSGTWVLVLDGKRVTWTGDSQGAAIMKLREFLEGPLEWVTIDHFRSAMREKARLRALGHEVLNPKDRRMD